MNLKNSRRAMVMLGVVGCFLLALTAAIGISSASFTILCVKPTASGSGDCSDWDNACTLQTALGDADTGDEIWVMTGVYTPTTTSTDRTVAFQLKSGVGVYGGFVGTESSLEDRDWQSNITVLSGDIDDSDIADPNGVVTTTANITGTNSYHVVTGSGTDATAVLDGFTITGGNADGISDPHDAGGGMYNDGSSPMLVNVTFSGNSADYGGGMSNINSSSPALTNVTFSGNSAHDGGGMDNRVSSPTLTNVTFSGNSAHDGGGMFNADSSPTLTNVTFSGNSAYHGGGGMSNTNSSSPALTNVTFSDNSADWGGGMDNWYYSSPTLTNVTFSGNSAYDGGGMVNRESSPILTNVTFSGNSAIYGGGGVYNWDGSPMLTNVTFSGNSADYGGGMSNINSSSPALTNVTFSGNSAHDGGGMVNADSSPTLTNVTFSGNSADLYGGGMRNENSSPTVANCILWGNTAGVAGDQIYNDGSIPTISYSLVQGSGGSPGWDGSLGIDGGFNIDADPLFVDAPNGDLRLQATSPAIDAGDNDALPADTLDLDGDGNTTEKLPFDLDGNPRVFCIVDMGAYESRETTICTETYLPLVLKSYAPWY